MGVFTGKGDHDYCAVPPRSSEKGSRFLVQNCEGFKRVEANTASISSICQEWGKPDIFLFASRVSHQVVAYIS